MCSGKSGKVSGATAAFQLPLTMAKLVGEAKDSMHEEMAAQMKQFRENTEKLAKKSGKHGM